MARLQGKVAFITGAARGMGRTHAIRLAEEGADIIAVDLAPTLDGVDGLSEIAKEVEARGRRIVVAHADVRDFESLKTAVDHGVAELGRLDIVVANAGILRTGLLGELDEQSWRAVIDINLTGAWLTAKAAIPHLRAADGGAITIISSTAGFQTAPTMGAYAASKHGVAGLMKTLAVELGADRIRVNTVHPTTVNTEMMQSKSALRSMLPDREGDVTIEDVIPIFQQNHLLPVPWVETDDVSNAVIFLSSDEARYVTGIALPVDAGTLAK
ncbi:mycofactocin-coupled SDR family oxidoreductase [Streptomyces cadmiisoli]|uniref:SDR family mycofactocin-dependent oxidoreductase n=1 Tax=Streptomyces cadmiisoli TaxID=2184053 RepID=A0A2Z4J968_9ACTN|nr:mycofactocin-coupled SDR family oxidoreductase [Streptomyces cadmiisoli]AWW41742.1 SDR family mycofactocin-dependent oxidoreductase [Streptomyces cadmiisoli]